MKHVGMNVCADAFVNAAITGVNGGVVVVAADDPGMHSSQNEQDSRFYGKFSMVPVLEPSNQQEAYDMLAALGIGTDFRPATLHNNMSILCQDMGDFDNALDHLNKALGILSQLYDAEMEVAITYTNIAQVHLAAGNMEGAKEAALESIRAFRENDGYGDVHYSAALEIFGQICLAEGDKVEALKYFEEARDLIARDYGMDNPTYEAICQSIERCDGC